MMGAGMKRYLAAGLVLAAGAVQAQDTSDLDNLSATIWTDPNGCQHWLMDDGVEGYLTPRRGRDGKPVCPGVTEQRRAQDSLPRVTMQATVWTDPNGCEHWVSDHGLDGYMSERLTRDGRPVCPGRN